MRRLVRWFWTLPVLLAVACGGAVPATSTGPSFGTGPSGPTSSSVAPSTVSPTPEPSPVPSLPAGLPPSFDDDVPAANVPAAALIPLTGQVTGTWYGFTSAGEAMAVAWLMPGDDPFRLARGVAVWRRFADGGAPWRPVWGVAYPKRAAILSVDGVTADLTGDGSDDLLLFATTGGSGGCGTYAVVDMALGIDRFERALCDGRVEPSTTPVGLLVTESVYAPGDPHCCPSALRRTVLTWNGSGWSKVSSQTTPT